MSSELKLFVTFYLYWRFIKVSNFPVLDFTHTNTMLNLNNTIEIEDFCIYYITNNENKIEKQ